LAKKRLAEADAAGEFLGIKKENRHFLKFFDQELRMHIEEAVEKIKDILEDVDRFVIPSANNDHPDHQATYEIAVKVAEELNLKNLEFYVYALYNPLKVQDENLVKIRIGNLRFKVYNALKLHKSQFFMHDMKLQSLAIRGRRRERFGSFKLKDKNNFYNF